MKILAITYSFVPLQFPATFRLLKWFKYLDEVGHKVTVLSVDPESFVGPKDDGLARLVPPGVENVQIKSPENTILYRILRKGASWYLPLFQPWKREWYGPARKALRRLPLEEYDVVLSCSQPPICHLLGQEVKRQTGLPWVAYFSDPWAENPFRSNVPRRIRAYNLALERDVVFYADRVVFSSDETRRMVSQRYLPHILGKAGTLGHCFVPEWFHLAHVADSKDNGVVRVLLTGNFYGPRTPIPFLQTLEDLDKKHNLSGRMLFEFLGSISPLDLQNPIWSSVKNLARFNGSTDYLTSLAMMRRADYLLLIDAPLAPGVESVFFPSKLAEYIGSGRPIIGLTPEKGASTRILRETGNLAFDLSDRAGIDNALTAMAGRQISIEPDRGAAAKYDYRRAGQQLVDILETTANGR